MHPHITTHKDDRLFVVCFENKAFHLSDQRVLTGETLLTAIISFLLFILAIPTRGAYCRYDPSQDRTTDETAARVE